MTKGVITEQDKTNLILNNKIGIWLIILGILSGLVALKLFFRKPNPNPQIIQNQTTPVAVKPAPEEIAKYEVAADLPKYIAIPAINLSQVRVIKLGISKNSQIIAPANLFDTGWYQDSAKPGQPGATFIYGHVSSLEANGAFHDLNQLKAGDEVRITRGNNSQLTYRVVKLEVFPTDRLPMDKVLTPITASRPGLNLMTCAGKINQNTHEFPERLVVFTSLVNN